MVPEVPAFFSPLFSTQRLSLDVVIVVIRGGPERA